MKMARSGSALGRWIPTLIGLALALEAARALACGGFFCGRQPVDQTAERIERYTSEGLKFLALKLLAAVPAACAGR